ncbi:hypothetical protein [Massilia sp. CCM 8734]|uniref:hypothetical protein n=1 Tax=Massilia sp. CCM 8734 TaxID=2609283 RepID=UPI0014213577|nr:hypothetical protein [Massilia sp. CCM 8734]NHZ94986.1 hypothetical protein [Massilia sp. CCM 8734]
MKKAVLAICVTVGVMSLAACKLDKGELQPGESKTEKRSQDGRWRTCSLPDGSAFVLTADAPDLGKHDAFHSGRVRDSFAAAFYVKYQGKNVSTTLTSFNDDHPDCVNYAISEHTLYALTDEAIFRFMAANGKRGGSVLVVSGDGGHTFSENIHPNALEKAGGNQQIHAAFQAFGYYRSRFRVVGSQYQLEITDPLRFDKFLLFVSADGGKAWTGPSGSVDPTVFSSTGVDGKRAQFASNEWGNKVFEATTKACKQRPGPGCASATGAYWDTQWRTCLSERPAPACLKTLPDPTPRFPENEAGT